MFREYFTTRSAYRLLDEYGTSEMKEKVDAMISAFMCYIARLEKYNIEEYKRLARNIASGYESCEWVIRTTDPDDEDFKSNHGLSKIKLGRKNENGSEVEELELTLFDGDPEEHLKATLKGAKIQLIKYGVVPKSDSPFKYNLNIDMIYVEKLDSDKKKFVTTYGSLFGGKYETKKETVVDSEAQSEN